MHIPVIPHCKPAPWQHLLLNGLHFIQPEPQVWHPLTHRSCIGVSDGSSPHCKGSFAWVISTTQRDQLAHCSGPIYGHNISSYRAESYGILSLVHFLYTMTNIHTAPLGPPLRTHTLHCDNESLVKTITTLQAHTHITQMSQSLRNGIVSPRYQQLWEH